MNGRMLGEIGTQGCLLVKPFASEILVASTYADFYAQCFATIGNFEHVVEFIQYCCKNMTRSMRKLLFTRCSLITIPNDVSGQIVVCALLARDGLGVAHPSSRSQARAW